MHPVAAGLSFWFSAAGALVLAGLVHRSAAAIPITEAKGFLNVRTYNSAIDPQALETDATRTARTKALNEALSYAYTNNVALYFPPGTYEVNDTLRAYTAFVNPSGSAFAVPRNAIAVIGSTLGPRPVIRLVPAPGDTSFDAGRMKPIVSFKNFGSLPPADEEDDDSSRGYFQMFRGIDIDCGGKAGAVGLYFAQAQNSSVENVRIVATGAFAGMRGLPSRTWGVVNIEVIGGQYGLDNLGVTGAGAGTVIAGARLWNQTVSAVRHSDFCPMVIVGFEIQTPAASTQAALTIQSSASANAASLALIDGSIVLGAEPSVAAIDNDAAGQSIHVRNVYVSGGGRLIKSQGQPLVGSANGPWRRIDDYSFCDQSAVDSTGKITQVLVNGSVSRSPPDAALTGNAGDPPADLVSRHRWVCLPAVEDPDAVDATAPPAPLAAVVPAVGENDPAVVDSAVLQAIIDAHRKVFLPKGIYRLTAPGIVLRPDTILFGAARNLTRIETDPAWKPTRETPVVRSDAAAGATTYVGDLTIGVRVRPGDSFAQMADASNDFFTALDWQAGRDSMVHIGQPYRIPDASNPSATQDHSLLKIHGPGGGRWYFAGAIKTGTSQHPGYRIVEVNGTSEPLWFYGLNPEHALGASTFCEFTDASNIRIYTVKSEFSNAVSPLRGDSVLLQFTRVRNVGMYGHGAVRNAVLNHGVIEFNDSSDVQAVLINPQNNANNIGLGPNHHTVRQTDGSAIIGVEYPNCVALFRKGVPDDAAMVHHALSYGPEQVFTSIGAEDGWVGESLKNPAAGGTHAAGERGPWALRVGDNPRGRQYRSIVSFDTAGLPAVGTAVIHAATLELVRGDVLGNPGALGALRADLATGTFGVAGLEAGDFQAAATVANVIPLFQIPAANGDVVIGVLSRIGEDAINRTGQTQFRLSFSNGSNNNRTADLLGCFSGDDPIPANRPVLRIQYRQP